MINIDIYVILKIVLLLLVLAIVSVYSYDFLKYRKLYRMYRKEMIITQRLESISRRNPLIPKPKSKRYLAARKMLSAAGIYVNVEYFFTIKLLTCILGMLFFIGVFLTNSELFINDVIKDPNYGKTAMDRYVKASAATQEKEKNIYLSIKKQLGTKMLKGMDFNDKNNKAMLIEYIADFITGSKLEHGEEAEAIAARMYQKLLKLTGEKADISRILYILLIMLLLYNMPDIIVKLKIKLIEDKKDWEILNCTYVYSIFGRLPPYNIKTILANMLVVAEVFKPLLSELSESLKNGKGEKAFDEVLQKTENQDMFEMLETMKLSIKTGMLNTVELIDDTAENQLKWLEIKGIKRRKTKQLFAMIPVVIVMLLAAVYFSYSLSVLSNPSNFIK